jgi:hypothetical protein
MFKFDETRVPEVVLESSWGLADGFINDVYKAGGWSFETSEESGISYAESAIYAWIAWHNFLQTLEGKGEES